jgi:hypothetical protein
LIAPKTDGLFLNQKARARGFTGYSYRRRAQAAREGLASIFRLTLSIRRGIAFQNPRLLDHAREVRDRLSLMVDGSGSRGCRFGRLRPVRIVRK